MLESSRSSETVQHAMVPVPVPSEDVKVVRPSIATVDPKSANLPLKQRRWLWMWGFFLVVVYGSVAIWAGLDLWNERHQAAVKHDARLSPTAVEPGLTPPDPVVPAPGSTDVDVGIYVDNIDTFSIRDSSWSATFLLWFRWTGDASIDPAARFQLVDGKVEKKELVEEVLDGDIRYQRVRVTARFSKQFNTTRVPLDDHLLTIAVEDASRDGTLLRFHPSTESNVSSRVRVAGYRIARFATVVKPHTYRSQYNDPRAEGTHRKTFYQFLCGIHIQRASSGIYLKLLLGLFAGVLLTLASFFIRPADTSPRFSLPTASYFGAVANSYLISSNLPSTGQYGLIDYASSIGLFTIFLCVSASLASGHQYIVVKDERFSRAIDQVTRTLVFILYAAVNIILPFCALERL